TRLVHAGQRRAQGRGQLGVVVAHDGQVLRDAQPGVECRADDPGGGAVGGDEQGGGRVSTVGPEAGHDVRGQVTAALGRAAENPRGADQLPVGALARPDGGAVGGGDEPDACVAQVLQVADGEAAADLVVVADEVDLVRDGVGPAHDDDGTFRRGRAHHVGGRAGGDDDEPVDAQLEHLADAVA